MRQDWTLEISGRVTISCPWIQFGKVFKVFGVTEPKGFFPYDPFPHANQLDGTILSPYEAFYWTIRNCNVLEEEHAAFQKLVDQGKSEQDASQTETISDFDSYGLKIIGHLLLIFLNGTMI